MTDEINSNGEAPADAATDPSDKAAQAEERAAKAVAQRRELGAKLDAQLAENAKLAAELEKLRGAAPPAPPSDKPPGQADPGDDMPPWARQLADQVKGLGAQFESHKTNSATEAATKAILAQVPDGAKKTVEVMLPGLGVDLTSPTAVADAMAALTTHHTAVMVDHSRGAPRRAPQTGPDGKLNFDAFTSIDDIPPEHRGAAFRDPKTLQRLVAGASGASTRADDGHNI
jgi:hypothetical protein